MNKFERFEKFASTSEVRANLRRKSTRAGLYTGISGLANLAMRLGSTAILARLVLPEHFGLVMMTMAVTAIADQLRELGLSAATVQRQNITHEEVSNLFWINAGIGLIITVIVCAASPLISSFYHEPRLTLLTCVMALNFVFGGLMVQHQALLTRQLKLGQTSSIRFLSGLFSNLLAILLAWLGHGIWALITREVSRSAFLAGGMWIACRWVPSLPSRKTNISSLLTFGANLTAANVITSIVSGADRFLIGRSFGAAAVGVYRQAFQLITAPTDQLLSPLYQVAGPALSMLQSDAGRFQRCYQTIVTLVAGITMPLSLFVAVYSREVTLLLLGPAWLECAPLIMILSFGTFMRQCVGSSALVLVCRGNSQTHLTLTLLNNAALVLGYFVGIQWGITGVAVAEVAVVYLTLAPKLYYSLKASPVTFAHFFNSLARPAVASLVTGLGLYFGRPSLFAHSSNTLSLIVGASICAIGFVTIWSVLPGGTTELRYLIAQLRNGLKPASQSMVSQPSEITP